MSRDAVLWLARRALEVACARRERWPFGHRFGWGAAPPVCLRADGTWEVARLMWSEEASTVLCRHSSGEVAVMVLTHSAGRWSVTVMPPRGVRLTGCRPRVPVRLPA